MLPSVKEPTIRQSRITQSHWRVVARQCSHLFCCNAVTSAAICSLSPQAPHSPRQCWSHCFSLELYKEQRCEAQAISAKSLKGCLTATFPKPVHTAPTCFLMCLFFSSLLLLKRYFQCVWFHFSPIKCAVLGASLFNSKDSRSSAWINATLISKNQRLVARKKKRTHWLPLHLCVWWVGWSNLTIAIKFLYAPHCLSSGNVQMNGKKQLQVQGCITSQLNTWAHIVQQASSGLKIVNIYSVLGF